MKQIDEKFRGIEEMNRKLEESQRRLEDEHKRLESNHNAILKKKQRENYESGSVVYIISHQAFMCFYGCEYFKIGKAKQNKSENRAAFVSRLSTYNTGAPENYTVHYLLYIQNVDSVESILKEHFEDHLDPSNKE